MGNATLSGLWATADGNTPAGATYTITLKSNSLGCSVNGGFWAPNGGFNVNGTLIVDATNATGSSVSIGSYGSSTYTGAIIGSGGILMLLGNGTQGNANSLLGNTVQPNVNFFNIAGNTVNNGSIIINNTSLFNYQGTSSITGSGSIVMNNVTLASDFRNNQYCYWNTTSMNISGQTIDMTNSQITFGDKNGNGSISNVTINCNGGNNYIAINYGMVSNVSGLKIRGFGGGDKLDLGSYGYGDWCSYDPKTGILTISTYDSRGTVFSIPIDIGLGYDPNGFSKEQFYTGTSGDAGITYLAAAPCYLSGTLIETAQLRHN